MTTAQKIEALILDEQSFLVKIRLGEGLDLGQTDELLQLIAILKQELAKSETVEKRTAAVLMEVPILMLANCSHYPKNEEEKIVVTAFNIHDAILDCLGGIT